MLQVEEIDRPSIGPDEVLVGVVAAGLDRGVWHLMTGLPYLVRAMGYGLSRPKQPVLGSDVAGRVVAVGKGVERLAVGDAVFGVAEGSFAEFAKAKESKLVKKPESVSFEHGAVATISGITALQGLTKVGRLEAGQHVLIIGASGGVGSFAVQIAKALDATVTGVASTAKLDFVRSLGADHVIDYTTTEIDEGNQKYDLILDIGGRNPLARLRRALATEGSLVIVGGEGGGRLTGGLERQIGAALASPFASQRFTFFISAESLEYIEPLAEYLADGTVVPVIGESYSLEQVPDAMKAMEAGTLTGKAVISV